MRKITTLLTICLFLVDQSASAQQMSGTRKNIAKVNLTSLIFFKNASVQYERVLSYKSSFAIGASFMPKRNLPFAEDFQKYFADNANVKLAFKNTQLSNFTITPEFRIYMSDRAPRGFYVAPFARYQHMNLEQVYQFTTDSGRVHKPVISGNINNIGGGLLFGTQWLIGKRLTLDWWIAGPHVGRTNGLLSGTANMSDLTAADRSRIEKEIESTDLPLTDIDATVSPNKIDVKLSGGYAGLRAFGFNLGFRF